MKFVCKKCDYEFKVLDTEGCPRCGDEKFEGEKDASDLLGEVERLLKS